MDDFEEAPVVRICRFWKLTTRYLQLGERLHFPWLWQTADTRLNQGQTNRLQNDAPMDDPQDIKPGSRIDLDVIGYNGVHLLAR